MDAVSTAAQTLIILVDIPHTRTDALNAGAVPHVTRLLGPVRMTYICQISRLIRIVPSSSRV